MKIERMSVEKLLLSTRQGIVIETTFDIIIGIWRHLSSKIFFSSVARTAASAAAVVALNIELIFG